MSHGVKNTLSYLTQSLFDGEYEALRAWLYSYSVYNMVVQCLALLICVVTIVYVFSMRMGSAGWYLIGGAVVEVVDACRQFFWTG